MALFTLRNSKSLAFCHFLQSAIDNNAFHACPWWWSLERHWFYFNHLFSFVLSSFLFLFLCYFIFFYHFVFPAWCSYRSRKTGCTRFDSWKEEGQGLASTEEKEDTRRIVEASWYLAYKCWAASNIFILLFCHLYILSLFLFHFDPSVITILLPVCIIYGFTIICFFAIIRGDYCELTLLSFYLIIHL